MVHKIALSQEPLRGSTRRPDLIPHLPALRATLTRHRSFRRDQLAYLNAHQQPTTSVHRPRVGDADAVRARREVWALVTAGARRALADIELALTRMDTGDYGRCHRCGADIALAVLRAIPRTVECLRCSSSR